MQAWEERRVERFASFKIEWQAQMGCDGVASGSELQPDKYLLYTGPVLQVQSEVWKVPPTYLQKITASFLVYGSASSGILARS